MEIPDSSAARTRRLTDSSTPAVRRRPAPSSEAASSSDSIEVSAEGRSLVGTDEVSRARRVAELRARVDAGAYTVDPSALARRLAERGEA